MPSKRRILCVDDQADVCDLICTILKDFEVVSAQGKTEGLRKAQGKLFDLYLLDYSLPDGTGLELATLIRQFDDSTPILIMTSPLTLTDRQVSDADAQGLISKDEMSHDLLGYISRILNHAEDSHSR
jgi:CheY-like chemotaxis protein